MISKHSLLGPITARTSKEDCPLDIYRREQLNSCVEQNWAERGETTEHFEK